MLGNFLSSFLINCFMYEISYLCSKHPSMCITTNQGDIALTCS